MNKERYSMPSGGDTFFDLCTSALAILFACDFSMHFLMYRSTPIRSCIVLVCSEIAVNIILTLSEESITGGSVVKIQVSLWIPALFEEW